jgi:hypothetical protein
MASHPQSDSGIERLIQRYTDQFSVSENLDFYSRKDFEKAKKQFVKYCLKEGCALGQEETRE